MKFAGNKLLLYGNEGKKNCPNQNYVKRQKNILYIVNKTREKVGYLLSHLIRFHSKSLVLEASLFRGA
jgi:hypothetical protein